MGSAWGGAGMRAIPANRMAVVSDAPPTGGRAAVRAAILSYLSKHPSASDTAAGICSWWLPEEGLRGSVDVVAEVLEQLVAQELLRRVRLPEGTVIYRSEGGRSGTGPRGR